MYKIAVTGHRNLKKAEITIYKEKVKKFLLEKKAIHGNKLVVMTPLAEGADRLVAEVAINLNIRYEALLPMRKELYIMDWTRESINNFYHLLKKASKVHTLALSKENNLNIKSYKKFKEYQYQYLGTLLVKNCDQIIVLWDRRFNDKIGGTSNIVKEILLNKKSSFFIICKREVNV